MVETMNMTTTLRMPAGADLARVWDWRLQHDGVMLVVGSAEKLADGTMAVVFEREVPDGQ